MFQYMLSKVIHLWFLFMSGLIGIDLPFYLKISKNDQTLVFKIVLKGHTITLNNYLINRENDFPSMLRNLKR